MQCVTKNCRIQKIFLGIVILMVLLHVPQTISLLLASCAPNSLICTRYSIFFNDNILPCSCFVFTCINHSLFVQITTKRQISISPN